MHIYPQSKWSSWLLSATLLCVWVCYEATSWSLFEPTTDSKLKSACMQTSAIHKYICMHMPTQIYSTGNGVQMPANTMDTFYNPLPHHHYHNYGKMQLPSLSWIPPEYNPSPVVTKRTKILGLNVPGRRQQGLHTHANTFRRQTAYLMELFTALVIMGKKQWGTYTLQ